MTTVHTELVKARVALAIRVQRLVDVKLKEEGLIPELRELEEEAVRKEVVAWDATYKHQRRLTLARAQASAAVCAVKALLNRPEKRESYAKTFGVNLTADELQLK